MWMLITKTGVRKSTKVITISETTKQDLIRIGCPEEKIVVIVNRVDPKFRKKDLPKRHSVFCMGQLAPRKNMEDALRAFIELTGKEGMDDWTITFCGDGPNRDNILSMASEAGISERVKIVTGISEEEVIDLYNEATLVFNTSLLEGTGLVTLEAQRCGTPVLHLDRAQIPEPVTRLSVGCEDPSDMAEKAYALISDPEAYDDLCRRSKEYADAFGGDFKERYLALLEEVRNS
jgi:glycosyltransferase involved in cell wall biosynthesis